ncbi:GIY-YIG nuclease family protein [Actinomycetospora sp. C-140]
MSDLDDVVRALAAPLAPLDEAVAALGRDAGLVAWWGTDVAIDGPAHPTDDGWTLLDVGDATMLRNRVTRQDLYRAGVSPFRRALAGLLLDDLGLAPTWAADVILTRADEDRLSEWMRAHLRLSSVLHPDRKLLLGPVRDAMAPGLREDGATARSARERFAAAGGPRPDRDPSVPFRRP